MTLEVTKLFFAVLRCVTEQWTLVVITSYRFSQMANLLQVSSLVTSHIQDGKKLILMRYLNLWLRYYYFHVLKTNGCHIEILLPVSILTLSPSWHVIVHHFTKFIPNCKIGDRVLTSYSFFQDGGHMYGQIYF